MSAMFKEKRNREPQKVRWTEEEDNLLRKSVQKYGPTNWKRIAEELPNRNGKQCRERWVNQITPGINKNDWNFQEDLLLVKLSNIYGHKWSTISKFFAGRSVNAIKNRWTWINRHSGYVISLYHAINCGNGIHPETLVTEPINTENSFALKGVQESNEQQPEQPKPPRIIFPQLADKIDFKSDQLRKLLENVN
ncbi:Myb-like DNA-binding domain containing protein [Histomonas meleagridis]|uniref:Myb-like DNA-binding domain containing protein n=1 Tax=Histomonas meleagridis TaxID=135588 RepID=UPI00355A310B|nr:Myb-like DNA-binding domain containing protein [Histomonas meleagridis]KAH0798397.1 Myb-like DNA-binding domain containing protein [Histomonas meleagridis]